MDINIKEELDKVFDDYMKERNLVPRYAKFLADQNPEFLVHWFAARRTFMFDGEMPAKYKELLLVAGAAARLSEHSVRAHLKTALSAGATKGEALETAFCVWLSSGMPSMNLCLAALEDLIAEEG